MSASNEKPPCDCLNFCGDDPWLEQGRAKPCADAIERQQREQQHRQDICRLHAMIDQLGAAAQARQLITVDASLVAELQRLVQALVRR